MPSGDRSNRISIAVDPDHCVHAHSTWALCGRCVNACPGGAITFEPGVRAPQVDPTLCLSCGQCLSACPLGAFTSPGFSERQLMARVERERAITLRCFLPYGEVDLLGREAGTYHLSCCLTALSPGVLYELALERPCLLITDRCTRCPLYARTGRLLRQHVRDARALLADCGRAGNLRLSVELAGDEGEAGADVAKGTGAAGGAAGGAGSAGAAGAAGGEPAAAGGAAGGGEPAAALSSEGADEPAPPARSASTYNAAAAFRALFARVRPEGPARRPVIALRARKKHVPAWRMRLSAIWNDVDHEAVAGAYRWPALHVDARVCRACGICMQLCPTGSIAQGFGEGTFEYLLRPGTCIDCGLCLVSCPVMALRRTYRTYAQPFEEHPCFHRAAHACPTCGMPAFDERGHDLCSLCLATRP